MITGDMTIAQVLELDPSTANIFVMSGMHGLGCVMAAGKSIEEAAFAHGVDISKLIHKLNAYLASKQTA